MCGSISSLPPLICSQFASFRNVVKRCLAPGFVSKTTSVLIDVLISDAFFIHVAMYYKNLEEGDLLEEPQKSETSDTPKEGEENTETVTSEPDKNEDIFEDGKTMNGDVVVFDKEKEHENLESGTIENDAEIVVFDKDKEFEKENNNVLDNVNGNERFKDVECDVYEMLRNEELMYVSKTRKIVQFILFLILILIGGFLVLASRGLLFASMVSDRTTRHLAGQDINGK